MGLEAGIVLSDGKYVLLRELGTGAMSVVWSAVRYSQNKTDEVVLKFLSPESTKDPGLRERFLEEADLALQLYHPYIVRIYEIQEWQQHLFLVMERLWGRDLQELIQRSESAGEPIPWFMAVRFISMAAQALHYANTQTDAAGNPLRLIHRDIKPANLIFTAEGQLKIIDFGIAKTSISQLKTETGVVKGTIAYMSPEQLHAQELDVRSDLFSLGVVLYELCTGHRPFSGDSVPSLMLSILSKAPHNPFSFRPDLPPPLVDLLFSVLDKERHNRPLTALAFCQELEHLLSDFHDEVSPQAFQSYFSRHFPQLASEWLGHNAILSGFGGLSQSLGQRETLLEPDKKTPPEHDLPTGELKKTEFEISSFSELDGAPTDTQDLVVSEGEEEIRGPFVNDEVIQSSEPLDTSVYTADKSKARLVQRQKTPPPAHTNDTEKTPSFSRLQSSFDDEPDSRPDKTETKWLASLSILLVGLLGGGGLIFGAWHLASSRSQPIPTPRKVVVQKRLPAPTRPVQKPLSVKKVEPLPEKRMTKAPVPPVRRERAKPTRRKKRSYQRRTRRRRRRPRGTYAVRRVPVERRRTARVFLKRLPPRARTPGLARVRLDIQPSCLVIWRGQKLGWTPQATLFARPGRHRIDCISEEGKFAHSFLLKIQNEGAQTYRRRLRKGTLRAFAIPYGIIFVLSKHFPGGRIRLGDTQESYRLPEGRYKLLVFHSVKKFKFKPFTVRIKAGKMARLKVRWNR